MNLTVQPQQERETVAVVGMACTFPQAPDLETYWRNIVRKADCITETPEDRWDIDQFYDPSITDGSKIYAKRGGYLASPFQFNAAEFGIMPKAVEGGEPDQFLVLKTAADAMRDAGIQTGAGHDRTEFILGRGSYLSTGAFNLFQRTFIVDQTLRLLSQMHTGLTPEDLKQLKENLLAPLKPFQSETAPSVMPNITAGRVANRLGFMGPNYIIDAACASSLFAVDAAVSGLLSGKSDLALAGGVHIFNNVPFLSVFCALGAMSRQDRIRPFDKNADGLLPGEGVGIVVLKRKSDAERDGNRIYALIRSVGTSSDGRGISVAAPRVEGEVLSLQRAYQTAGISPDTLGLIEAHGTATVVGDSAEIESLTRVFGQKEKDAARHCALGSVKSMIGHAMPAAGIAGLIKTSLALYHKVLPATLNCDEPHPKYKLDQTPFYINTETRPWFRMAADIPRRAGVNAFGFGGVNAHVVMEEYESATVQSTPASGLDWDAALFLFSGTTAAELADQCQGVLNRLEKDPAADSASSLEALSISMIGSFTAAAHRLSVIADSVPDLIKKLHYAVEKLKKTNCKKIKDIKGIYYFAAPLGKDAKIAFMFPGEGSPYTNMMADLCLQFPEIRASFDELNSVIAARIRKSRFLPSQFIFPATLLTQEEKEVLEAELWKVDSGLQAILVSSLAMNSLLDRFGVRPDMIVGHSAGEYSAWIASGILDKTDFYEKQEDISAIYAAHRPPMDTAMAAVSSHRDKIRPLLNDIQGQIFISNDNCPHQVVVVGDVQAMAQFTTRLKDKKIMYTDLPSKEVHHTPLANEQAEALTGGFGSLKIAASRVPAYSAVTAAPYPEAPKQILDLMVAYWLKTLKFRETVERMYADGARIFIEVGPGTNLSGFVDDTLRGKSFITVPANNNRRSGVTQLCHLLGMLVAHHVPVSLDYYMQSRSAASLVKPAAPTKKGAVMDMDLGLKQLCLAPGAASLWQKALKPEENPPGVEKPSPPATTETKAQPTLAAAGPPPQAETVSPKARIMQQYMENMERFLSLQKDMMNALTGRKHASGVTPRPFVGRVKTLTPHRHCRTQRSVHLKEDIFLYDHPFGGDVSDTDSRLFPLIVTPLTLNIEMMTEAASVLVPDKPPVEIRNVRASRWVVVEEDEGVELETEAQLISDSEVSAKLFDMSAKLTASTEAVVAFGAQYPPSAVTTPVSADDIDPEAIHRAREIYAQKYMTHGPRFQIIAGVTQTGEKELVAHLKVPSEQNLFATLQGPRLLVNPMLLDACAQLTGFWAQKALKEGFITFPAGVQRIRFLAPPPKPGELLRCHMRIREINPNFLLSDLDIIRNNGRVWAVVQGWTHRRFELPMELYRFYKFPRSHAVSRTSRVQEDVTSISASAVICQTPYYENLNQTIWQKAIGYLYLNRAERKTYRDKLHRKKDANRWLATRMAAKDAVRLHINSTERRNLLPADIEIKKIEEDRYAPRCSSFPQLAEKLIISVSHTDQFATALVVEQTEIHRKERMKNA